MKTLGIFDAKKDLSLLLDEVESGSEVAITRQGQRVARIEPVSSESRSAQEVEEILADFRAFQDQHRGALRGLNLEDLIESGRRY